MNQHEEGSKVNNFIEESKFKRFKTWKQSKIKAKNKGEAILVFQSVKNMILENKT